MFSAQIYQHITHVVAGHFINSALALSRGSGDIPPQAKHLLDVASGWEMEPATTLAAALPAVSVLATDALPASEVYNTSNLSFQQQRAEDLTGIANGSCDVVTCCLGLESLEDTQRDAALQRFSAVLKPGGILVMATWGAPEAVTCFAPLRPTAELLGRYLYDPSLASDAINMTHEGLCQELGNVGLRVMNSDEIGVLGYFQDTAQMWEVVVESGPWVEFLNEAEASGQACAVMDAARQSFEGQVVDMGFCAPHGGVVCNSAVRITTAVKPSGRTVHKPAAGV